MISKSVSVKKEADVQYASSDWGLEGKKTWVSQGTIENTEKKVKAKAELNCFILKEAWSKIITNLEYKLKLKCCSCFKCEKNACINDAQNILRRAGLALMAYQANLGAWQQESSEAESCIVA